MFKQAYLIIAHHEFELLEYLLLMLDHPANDIYIHIDKKVQNIPKELYSLCKCSKVYFIEKRYCVSWGKQSVVKAEIALYKSAVCKYNYNYYHLISGVDLPLKSQDELIAYLKKENGKEYIDFDLNGGTDKRNLERLQYYWLNWKTTNRLVVKFNSFFMKLQQNRVNRLRRIPYSIQKGAQWCSLTHKAVKILLKNEKFIYKMTFMTNCADEMWKQTILYEYFKENVDGNKLELANNNLRYIDWERGNKKSPHIFTIDDKTDLINSRFFFARKFSYELDKTIVEQLFDYIVKEK